MSFDAGEIKARLILDRDKFNEGLDEARAEADAWSKDGVDLPIKPELDDKAVAEVEAEKEILATPVEFEVKPKYGSLLGSLLGAGATKGELIDALTNSFFGLNKGDAKGIVTTFLGSLGAAAGGVAGADAAVKALLPAPADMNAAFSRWLMESTAPFSGAIPLGQGSTDLVSLFGPALGNIGSGAEGPTSGFWRGIVGDLGGAGGAAIGGDAATVFADAIFPPGADWGATFDGAIQRDKGSILSGLEGSISNLFDWLQMKWMSGVDAHGGGFGGGAGFISELFSAPFDSLSSGQGGVMGAVFSPIGASAATAFLGAFGAAISGGLAATLVGSAGTLVALLPGFLDLTHGMAAYSALTTPGGSTAGMSAGAISLGKSLKGLLGAGKGGLGAAENQVMPQIEKFVAALTKAIPLMSQFAKPAIAAMTGFFNAIDRGLGSGGFKSFVGSMSKVVGPIMTEFGKVILNLAGAFGGFLKLFAGVGAREIGPWFVKITGELNHFLNHVKLGHGFVKGMVTVFSNLGKILGTMWTAVKLLADALAPVGLQVFRIIGWLAVWAGRILKMVPPQVIVTLATFFVTLITVAKGIAMVSAAMEFLAANPVALVIAGIVAVIVVAYELYKHWKTVWGFIKRITLDVWHFLDQDIFQPIARWLGPGIKADLDVFQKIWGVVWGGLHAVVKGAWDVIKPIFDAIKTGIKDIIKGVSDAVGALGKIAGFAGKVGGGLLHGITGAIGGAWNWLTGRADGGPVSANTPYIIGERGPELFVPNQSGTVVPNGKFGGQTIVFNINAQGHRSPEAVVGAVRGAIGATLPSLQAALARGAA